MSLSSIQELGAIGDGLHLDSPAIQAAIDAAGERGGGVVVIPPGIWRCGTLRLCSGLELRLEPGAIVRASHDLADYPVDNHDGDIADHHGRHLIVARGCRDLRIGGGGTIDGQGPAFWLPQDGPRSWIRPQAVRISPMIELDGCQDLVIDDLHLLESPGWTLHLRCCDRVRIRGVSIDNHRFGPNNDGFDLNGCRDVQISGCRIDTCDDAIVLKTSRDARSCERITISDCLLSTNCAAIKCGTESWHDFRQIVVSNCVITRSTRAFACYGLDGGTFEQISVSNCVCDTDIAFIFNHPIHLDARRRRPDSRPSLLRDISIRGFSALTDGRILLTAADGTRIENVTLDGISLRYALFCDPAPLAAGSTGHQCSRHSPEARAARAAIVVDGVHGLRLRDLRIAWPDSQHRPGWGQGLPRMENGGIRVFGPADHGDSVDFAVLWARGLRHSQIELGTITASDPDLPRCQLIDCEPDLLAPETT